jgi:hypothetical protein
MNKVLPVPRLLSKCALLCSALLLFSNFREAFSQAHAWISALPLAFAGVAYAVFQIRLRPNPKTLAKRLFLAATFLLWAFDQLLPAGRMATFIGDAVISAYVLDLFWLMQEQSQAETKFE